MPFYAIEHTYYIIWHIWTLIVPYSSTGTGYVYDNFRLSVVLEVGFGTLQVSTTNTLLYNVGVL